VSGTTVARFTRGGKVSRSRRAKPLKLRARKFEIRQNATGAVRIVLPKAAIRELARSRKLKLKLKLVQKGAKPVAQKITVTAPKKKRKRR
jgi:hypothetical protein